MKKEKFLSMKKLVRNLDTKKMSKNKERWY